MAKAKKMNRGITTKKQHETAPTNWIQYSSGHAVERLMTGYCGKSLSGWRSGVKEEITCDECRNAIEAKS